MSKEKEEKEKSSVVADKNASADVKGEGSEGKMESEVDKTKGEAHDHCRVCFKHV